MTGVEPHYDAHAALVVAPYHGGWISSTRPRDKRSHPGEIGLVGGKLDPGESAIAAVKREALEEGWHVHHIDPNPIHVKYNGDKKIVVFAGTAARKLTKYKEEPREIHQMTVTRDELARSHPGNTFIHLLDEANPTKAISAEAAKAVHRRLGIPVTGHYPRFGQAAALVRKGLQKVADAYPTTMGAGDTPGFGVNPPGPPPSDLNMAETSQHAMGTAMAQQESQKNLAAVRKPPLPPRKTFGLISS